MKQRMIGIVLLMAAMLCCFTACQAEKQPQTEATQTPTTEPPAIVEELALVVTEESINQLKQYPNLKKLDLSGSTCYQAIARYIEDHPQVEVTYTVDLGDTVVLWDTAELVLEEGAYRYEALQENLAYLPEFTKLTLPKTALQRDQVNALRKAYPDLQLDYTVMLLGQELAPDVTTLDLAGLAREDVDSVAQAMGLLYDLAEVELMDDGGSCALEIADVQKLVQAAPDAEIHYVFKLFGKTVSTTDKNIEFVGQKIGNQGEAELRQALEILSGCERLVLDDCGFDSEVLAQVRSDYPDTKVVWRVHVSFRSWLTDTEVLRAVYHVDDSNSFELHYCNEVKYLDLGHNTEMYDISFIAYMPNLEIVILSGSPITDLSAFAGCQNLEFLELAYCSALKDVSPLASCPNLKHLNISFSKVDELRCLDNLPLEQLCYLGASKRISWNEQEDIRDWHVDAVCTFSGKQPYGKGWRYVDNGYKFTEIYKKVREVFDYDAIDAILAGQNGEE